MKEWKANYRITSQEQDTRTTNQDNNQKSLNIQINHEIVLQLIKTEK